MEKDNLKIDRPQDHIITYLDMLGTASKIGKDDDYEYLRRLYIIYNSAIHIIQHEPAAKPYYGKIVVKIFSDNILMAIPLNSGNDIEDIQHLLQFTAIFQMIASIIYCWPVRGGITIGELFCDEIMVWGKGLIRAYNLENNIAVFPRVVIDQNVIRAIGEKETHVRHDADGWFFVDFLNYIHLIQGDDIWALFVRNSFVNQLKEIRKPDGTYEERPYQKLQWYKSYLNQWHNERCTPDKDTMFIDESTIEQNDNLELTPS